MFAGLESSILNYFVYKNSNETLGKYICKLELLQIWTPSLIFYCNSNSLLKVKYMQSTTERLL